MTDDLTTKHCVACEGGISPLTAEAIKKYLTQTHWFFNDKNKSIIGIDVR